MSNDRWIAHIHVDTRPGKCLWLSSPDGDVTYDVTQAYEFTEPMDAYNSANKFGQNEADKSDDPHGVGMFLRLEPMDAMPVPEALQRGV